MRIESELLLHIGEAIGLGLGAALVLWLLRGFAPVRRVQMSALSGAVAAGLYLVVRGSGIRAEPVLAQALVAAGVMLAANTALQLFDWLLWDYFLGQRRHLPIPRLLVDLFNFVGLTAVALIVLNRVFGVSLSGLLVTSTVVSAVIGLSLQDMLINVVAGVALQVEQPFAVGNWVQIGDKMGQVVQMSWRSLTLRTLDDNNVFLPNASTARQDIVNYTRPTPLQRLHSEIGVAPRHPPGLVAQVLAHAAAGAEGVAADPPPEVLVKTYGDFAIYYDVRYWITDYAHVEQIKGAVMARMWYELRRAGMTIPAPQRDVTLRTLPEDYEARVQEQQRREVFAALRPLTVFAPLTEAQIEQLAENASLQRYTTSEALVRQGDPGDSLFVVQDGRVRVEQTTGSGQSLTLATMGPDEFFGEMSLLTGEPRSASVIAEVETEVVVVSKAAFAFVLAADATIAEALSEALETRERRSIESAAPEAGTAARQPTQQAMLLRRIQRFFGIR